MSLKNKKKFYSPNKIRLRLIVNKHIEFTVWWAAREA